MGDLSQGLLKATTTKKDGSQPKELLIAIDGRLGYWRCGNGFLSDYIEYDGDQAVVLSWTTQNGRLSTTWIREVDLSSTPASTDEGTEDNLKETWWNMTEEWEDEKKCAIKAKIQKVNEAYEEGGKRNRQKPTRTIKNDAQSEGAKWVEVISKTQKATGGTHKNNPEWREVGAWKRDSERGGRRQHKSTKQHYK